MHRRLVTSNEKNVNMEDLPRVASEVAAALPMAGVVAVHGTMGAGKTTLVRAVLQAWGSGEEGASPTFGLVHHHTVDLLWDSIE